MIFTHLTLRSVLSVLMLPAAAAVRDASCPSQIEPSSQVSMKAKYATTTDTQALFQESVPIDAGWVFVKSDLVVERDDLLIMKHRGRGHLESRQVRIPKLHIRNFTSDDTDPRPELLRRMAGVPQYIIDSDVNALFSAFVKVPKGTVFGDRDYQGQYSGKHMILLKFKYAPVMKATGSPQKGSVWMMEDALTQNLRSATMKPFVVRNQTFSRTIAFLGNDAGYGFRLPTLEPVKPSLNQEPPPTSKDIDAYVAALHDWQKQRDKWRKEWDERKYISIGSGDYFLLIGEPMAYDADRTFYQALFESKVYKVLAIAVSSVEEGDGWCCCHQLGNRSWPQGFSKWKPAAMCEPAEPCRRDTPVTWMHEHSRCRHL